MRKREGAEYPKPCLPSYIENGGGHRVMTKRSIKYTIPRIYPFVASKGSYAAWSGVVRPCDELYSLLKRLLIAFKRDIYHMISL